MSEILTRLTQRVDSFPEGQIAMEWWKRALETLASIATTNSIPKDFFDFHAAVENERRSGISLEAAARSYATSNVWPCVVFELEPNDLSQRAFVPVLVRHIEPSPSFLEKFNHPREIAITDDHVLGPSLPLTRKSTRVKVSLADKAGAREWCVAESFHTERSGLIILYAAMPVSISLIGLSKFTVSTLR